VSGRAEVASAADETPKVVEAAEVHPMHGPLADQDETRPLQLRVRGCHLERALRPVDGHVPSPPAITLPLLVGDAQVLPPAIRVGARVQDLHGHPTVALEACRLDRVQALAEHNPAAPGPRPVQPVVVDYPPPVNAQKAPIVAPGANVVRACLLHSKLALEDPNVVGAGHPVRVAIPSHAPAHRPTVRTQSTRLA